MPRPKRHRWMNRPPAMKGFRPFGIPATEIEAVSMLFEEYEALKLADYELLNQVDAAKIMNVSRPTFTRIYENARRTIAKALAEGKAIEIEGGNVSFDFDWYKCNNCYHLIQAEKGEPVSKCTDCSSDDIYNIARPLEKDSELQAKNHENKGMGQGGFCICLNCGTKKEHEKAVPCRDEKCDKCGKPMVREGSFHHQEYLRKHGGRNS